MPQSKGTATWLTNVRQDAPLERVRLDNSRAKIENKKIDHEHGRKVEIIRMKYHRSKADIKFELKQAREEADRWRMMRLQLDKNQARSAVESRRKEAILQRQKLDGAKYTIIGPDGEILHSNANGTRQTGGNILFPSVKQSGKLFRKSVSVGGSETGDHNKRSIQSKKSTPNCFRTTVRLMTLTMIPTPVTMTCLILMFHQTLNHRFLLKLIPTKESEINRRVYQERTFSDPEPASLPVVLVQSMVLNIHLVNLGDHSRS